MGLELKMLLSVVWVSGFCSGYGLWLGALGFFGLMVLGLPLGLGFRGSFGCWVWVLDLFNAEFAGVIWVSTWVGFWTHGLGLSKLRV